MKFAPRFTLKDSTNVASSKRPRHRREGASFVRRLAALLTVTGMTLFGLLAGALSAHATAPGQNGLIAFRRYFNNRHTLGAIFTIQPDGSGLQQLTHRGKVLLDTEPDWSPDGRWIAFHRVKPDHPTLVFKMRANGTHITRLSHGPTDGDLFPAWSPNGKRIAFTRYDDSIGLVGLFVMQADGTRVHQIAGKPNKFEAQFAQWSPDGTRLVFEGGPDDRRAIWTIRLDGTHLQRLTPWKLHAGDGADWSPDGRWIVLESHQEQDRRDNLYLVHPNGNDLHKITTSPAHVHQWGSYSFSPDGTMITVAHNLGEGENPDIYVMNLDGLGLRDVTNSAIFDSAPDWGSRRR
jgi:TolB protein